MIKIDEKIPLPFYESAIINTENGSYSIAVEQIKVAIKLDPNNNRWYSLLHAEILFSKQDFVNAAIQYKKLIDYAVDRGTKIFFVIYFREEYEIMKKVGDDL